MIFNDTLFGALCKKVSLAFRVLRRNYGCPGTDGLSIRDIKSDFSFHKDIVIEILRDIERWDFTPSVRQVNTGNITRISRSICVYRLHERWALQTIRLSIAGWFKDRLCDCVFSYTKGKDRHQVLRDILNLDPNIILILDVKQCSANICTVKLARQLEQDGLSEEWVAILINCLKSPLSGVPPGNPLSPIIINYYLTSVDDLFTSGYARFSDDLIISLRELADVDPVIDRISVALRALGLELNHPKTRIHKVSDGVVAIPEHPWFTHSDVSATGNTSSHSFE